LQVLTRPRNLTLDVHLRQPSTLEVARRRDRDQCAQLTPRPQRDRAPVAAVAETGEQDPLRGRKPHAGRGIGQLPTQLIQLGRAAIDEQLHPQELPAATATFAVL
jgi:hypothetical protein